MSASGNARVGMRVFSSDGEAVGAVDGVTGEGITVGGQPILAGMVTGVEGDRVTLNYTTAQFLWQTGAGDEKDDAVSADPSGEGQLAERLEQQATRVEHGTAG